MRTRTRNLKIRIILQVVFCCLLFTALGCDAFIRKFTRKPKKENLAKEELVLEPEEYTGSALTKEELYRQYFLFWKSWQEELIASLSEGSNYKKRLDCAEEVIKNLKELRLLLVEERSKKLEGYINQMSVLGGAIEKDIYGVNILKHRLNAERLERIILKQFVYYKVKDYLK